jgi:hypothetical protein
VNTVREERGESKMMQMGTAISGIVLNRNTLADPIKNKQEKG